MTNFFSRLNAQNDTLFVADLGTMNQLIEKFTCYNLDRFQPNNILNLYNFSNNAWIKEDVPIYSNTQIIEYHTFALSTSLYVDGVQANDWLISHPIILPNNKNANLSWEALAFNTINADGYEVRIFTSLPDSNDLDNSSHLLMNIIAEKDRITAREISLADYKGDTIYIAFVNKSVNKYLLGIKNIKVITTPDYCLQSTSLNNIYPYHVVPFSQFNIEDAQIMIKNTGNRPLENLNITYYIQNSMGVEVYRNELINIIPLLNAGDSIAGINIGRFIPHYHDRYTLSYIISNDHIYFENSKILNIRQSFSRASLEHQERAYSLGQSNNQYGTSFHVINTEAPAELTAFVLSGSSATAITGFIYNVYPDGSPANIIAHTDTLPIHQEADGDYTLNFVNPQNLIAGDYIMVIEQIGGKLNLGFSYNYYMPNTNWFRIDNQLGGWVNLESIGSSYDMPPMISLTMNNNNCVGMKARIYEENDTLKTETNYAIHPLSYSWFTGEQTAYLANPRGTYYYVTITDANNCSYASYYTRNTTSTSNLLIEQNLKIYPNPTNKIINIEQNFNHFNQEIKFCIIDINGRKITEKTYHNASHWQISIDIEDYPQGIYIIHIQTDKDRFSRKFIKQ